MSRRLAYRRRFNLPSGLKQSSRVRFVPTLGGRLDSMSVNGPTLEIGETKINADITDLLKSHDQIVVRLAGGQTNQPGSAAR